MANNQPKRNEAKIMSKQYGFFFGQCSITDNCKIMKFARKTKNGKVIRNVKYTEMDCRFCGELKSQKMVFS